MTRHRQLHITHGAYEADVDEDIAELILACWQADVRTLASCQDCPSEAGLRRVQVAFYGSEVVRFLSAVADPYDDQDDSLYMRSVGGASGPRGWDFTFSVGDYALLDAARPDIRVRVFVVFPHDDVPEVVRRLRLRAEAP